MTANSAFYHPAGYLVMQTLPMSAQLKNIVPVDWHMNRMGTIAQILEDSQYNGISLRMLINSILERGDVLLLLSVILVRGSSPLITQFQIHQTMTFHLRIIVLLDYDDGMLQFFSKPLAPEMEPVSESFSISQAPMANYHFQVTLFREDLVSDAWILRQFQLALLTASVVIQIDAYIGHAGSVCLGPEDPYRNTPCKIYNSETL